MRQLIAGNRKMHGLASQLPEVEGVAATAAALPVDLLLCVPASLISRAAQTAAGRIPIGGENCRAEIDGAFTGDVSAEMLKDAGACAGIVGHSERRHYHHETDTMVAAKAKTAWRSGLLAIICIGEMQEQRHGGKAL